ncbi:MAG: hypothetical protein L6V85_05855 [Clostridiales bacterium]|nr:MAG: hypothetical protein L6V85_05855 [Clostridiales bacterium]
MLILGVDTTRDRLVAVLSDENKTYYKVSDEGNKKTHVETASRYRRIIK